MSSVWTIEGTTANGTFAALGLGNLRRSRTSQSPDVVFFEAPGAAYDGTALFAYGESITIKKDGASWFVGRCNTIPREGSGRGERIGYEVVGPWWHLEKCVYQQSWRVYDVGGAALTNVNKSRVILNQNAAGTRITSGAQIKDAINWAISRGAPITLGTVDPAVNLPFDECCDLTCAEVIVKMLRWSPDCVCWFAYSTSPNPTFHCRARANLTAVSVALNAGVLVEGNAITPRYDLQLPGITISYEKTHVVDDYTYETVELDRAGTTTALDSVFSTVELAGSHATYLTQKIVTEDWPADLNDSSFWLAHVPWLAGPSSFVIRDGVRSGAGAYPRILIEGTVQDWMNKDQEEETIEALVDYVWQDEDTDAVQVVEGQKITLTVISTDATTQIYRRLGTFDAGETTPTGVAAALYASWSILQYDGRISLREKEVGTALSIGPQNKLNLTNGVAAWATMDAVIQQVDEDVDSSRTTVTFGPAKHLDLDALISLLRAFRTRGPSWKYIARTTAMATDQGATELSGPTPRNEATGGGGASTKLVVKSSAGTKRITADPALITETGATDVQPREVAIIEPDGNSAYKRFAMVSEAYGDVINIGGAHIPEDPDPYLTLGSAAEGSETALTDTWEYDDTNGLHLWVVARVVYNESGDHILYKMMRELVFDKQGVLYSVSAETRVIVDVAVV